MVDILCNILKIKKHNTLFFACFFLILQNFLVAQNENKIWYFGDHAGLDFNISPPTVLPNSANNSLFGCSSVSDASGALLFYTDGMTVYDKSHNVMANGTGLGTITNTNSLNYQYSIIVKHPGNANLYFIFSNCSFGISSGIYYSIVDMSLAAGMGSVTTKNFTLSTIPPSGQMTVARHCNEKDFWLISHDYGSSNFRAFLISSGGVSNTPVISPLGYNGYIYSFMRVSPNGKKIATQYNGFFLSLFDFNPATALVSNSIVLSGGSGISHSGIEFSPDGTKLYTAASLSSSRLISQFDLCVGTASAVIASQYTVAATNLEYGIQLAPDGKIYVARHMQNALGVINNPNASGAACNYVDIGQNIAPNVCKYGLPAFVSTPAAPPQFTSNIQCQLVSFTNAAATNTSVSNCLGFTNSLTSCYWNFGDPLSGNSNTSTANQVQHFFSSTGTYTVKLKMFYPCHTDSVMQAIHVVSVSPSFSLSGPSSICKGETHTLTVNTPAYQYTWSSGASGTMAVVNPSSSIIYTVSANSGSNTCMSTKTLQVTVNKCLDIPITHGTSAVRVYPNPVTHNITIECPANSEMTICDAIGKIILTQKLSHSETTFELGFLETGLYFLSIRSGEQTYHKSFIKSD